MPFKSQAQEKFFFANKPGMAKEWAANTPNISALPQHVARPPSSVGASQFPKPKPQFSSYQNLMKKGY